MAIKKGTIFPEEGTTVHRTAFEAPSWAGYTATIAAALRHELGMTHQAVKLARRWTGASDRTVKYWFSGVRGAQRGHLVALARHSDAVLSAFLQRAGRQHLAGMHRASEARTMLREALRMLETMAEEKVSS